MALPGAVTMVTIRHTTNDVAGTLVAATVKVKPTARIWVPDGMMSLIPQDIPVTMDGDAYSFEVPAVDDPLLVGEDVTFTVTEYFAGWRTTHQIAPTLAQAPGPVGLFDTLVTGPMPGGAENFIDRIADTVEARIDAIPISEKGVALGVAELDGDGDVVDESGAKVSGNALADAKEYTDQAVDTRAPTVHTHTTEQVTGLSGALDGVFHDAKIYTDAEVDSRAPKDHTHPVSDIPALNSTIDQRLLPSVAAAIAEDDTVALAAAAAATTAVQDEVDARDLVDEPSLASTLTGFARSGDAAAASAPLWQKIRQGTADVSVVVNSDSTGTLDYRWVRKWALRLAAQFPSHTVRYSLINESSFNYPAATTLTTGTGPRTITVWNASISGAQLVTHQQRLDRVFADVDPDLVFVSQGHNEDAWSANNTVGSFVARYLVACAAIQAVVPGVPLVCIGQNPPTNSSAGDMPIRVRAIARAAQLRGYGFVDVCQAFLDHPDPASLYDDSVHPNSAGGTVWADTVWSAMYTKNTPPPMTQLVSCLTEALPVNLLKNGDFADFSDGLTGWTLQNVTAEKDTVNFENTGRGYGLKLKSPTSGQGFIYQQLLDATQVVKWRGKTVTVVARVRNNKSAESRNSGVLQLLDGTQVVHGSTDRWTHEAFVWRAVTITIAPDATRLQARMYADYASATEPNVTVDGIWLTEGVLPRKASTPVAAESGGGGGALPDTGWFDASSYFSVTVAQRARMRRLGEQVFLDLGAITLPEGTDALPLATIPNGLRATSGYAPTQSGVRGILLGTGDLLPNRLQYLYIDMASLSWQGATDILDGTPTPRPVRLDASVTWLTTDALPSSTP